jgi:hypothetical protein
VTSGGSGPLVFPHNTRHGPRCTRGAPASGARGGIRERSHPWIQQTWCAPLAAPCGWPGSGGRGLPAPRWRAQSAPVCCSPTVRGYQPARLRACRPGRRRHARRAGLRVSAGSPTDPGPSRARPATRARSLEPIPAGRGPASRCPAGHTDRRGRSPGRAGHDAAVPTAGGVPRRRGRNPPPHRRPCRRAHGFDLQVPVSGLGHVYFLIGGWLIVETAGTIRIPRPRPSPRISGAPRSRPSGATSCCAWADVPSTSARTTRSERFGGLFVTVATRAAGVRAGSRHSGSVGMAGGTDEGPVRRMCGCCGAPGSMRDARRAGGR